MEPGGGVGLDVVTSVDTSNIPLFLLQFMSDGGWMGVRLVQMRPGTRGSGELSTNPSLQWQT